MGEELSSPGHISGWEEGCSLSLPESAGAAVKAVKPLLSQGTSGLMLPCLTGAAREREGGLAPAETVLA